MTELQKRIIDISYKKELTHISSCLTTVEILDSIFQAKTKSDLVMISNGHAGLALYVILEKYLGKNAEELYDKHGTHPNLDKDNGIYCSSGSLGQAISVAVGYALADRERDVYCVISDGECAEGSVWESLRIAGELRLDNLKIVVNANGMGAYRKYNTDLLEQRIMLFFPSVIIRSELYDFPVYLNGLEGHYHKLSKLEYEELIREYAQNL